MYYVRFPLSLRQVEDILHERGIDVCHEGHEKLAEVIGEFLITEEFGTFHSE
jgi:transposase-like protein